MRNLVPIEKIENKIYFIRGKKVMLDEDLAELYYVETKILLQAVKRNKDRFPEDFMFQLDQKEYEVLRSQFVTSNKGRGGRRFKPFVFEAIKKLIEPELKPKRRVGFYVADEEIKNMKDFKGIKFYD